MFMKKSTRIGALALAAVLSTSLVGCGSDDDTAAPSKAPTSEAMASDTPTSPMTDNTDMTDTSATFGAACAKIPASGGGSLKGMATVPVATAASANPLLTTLVAAVKQAGLVDTLNTAKGITVFAPTDDAFAKVPAQALKDLLANKAELTKVLTHHVVAGQLTPADLAGKHTTLNGDTITVAGSGEDFSIGDAKVICGNVPTANATVYIVDSVLMP